MSEFDLNCHMVSIPEGDAFSLFLELLHPLCCKHLGETGYDAQNTRELSRQQPCSDNHYSIGNYRSSNYVRTTNTASWYLLGVLRGLKAFYFSYSVLQKTDGSYASCSTCYRWSKTHAPGKCTHNDCKPKKDCSPLRASPSWTLQSNVCTPLYGKYLCWCSGRGETQSATPNARRCGRNATGISSYLFACTHRRRAVRDYLRNLPPEATEVVWRGRASDSRILELVSLSMMSTLGREVPVVRPRMWMPLIRQMEGRYYLERMSHCQQVRE